MLLRTCSRFQSGSVHTRYFSTRSTPGLAGSLRLTLSTLIPQVLQLHLERLKQCVGEPSNRKFEPIAAKPSTRATWRWSLIVCLCLRLCVADMAGHPRIAKRSLVPLGRSWCDRQLRARMCGSVQVRALCARTCKACGLEVAGERAPRRSRP